MTAANFDRALAYVLVSEGGYVDNPSDPGGATNMGITLATLEAWRGSPMTAGDVKVLTKDEASKIYRADFWNKIHGDDLPSGLDYAVFDFAVNSGPKRAIEYLQKSIGVTVDGVMGPKTLAAVNGVDPSTAKADIVELCNERLIYLKSLPTWPTFGAGWAARVARVKVDAIRMAAPLTAAVPIPVTTAPPTPKGTFTMNASQFKALLGIITTLAGIAMPFIPAAFQPFAMMVIGVMGGGHALTSASTTDPAPKA